MTIRSRAKGMCVASPVMSATRAIISMRPIRDLTRIVELTVGHSRSMVPVIAKQHQSSTTTGRTRMAKKTEGDTITPETKAKARKATATKSRADKMADRDTDGTRTGTDESTETAKATRSRSADRAEAVARVRTALPGALNDYLAEHSDGDALAPMHGKSFVKNGTLFIQLEGRGGQARGGEAATKTGLKPWLDTRPNDVPSDATSRTIGSALTELGFTRGPFPYVHPERGSTAASYYNAPVEKARAVGIDVDAVPEFVGRRAAKKAAAETTTEEA
jgi:hypothetical protein